MKRHPKRNKNGKEYIKDLNDWNENRFNPGFYIGSGRIPPYLKYPRKRIGILLLVTGGICLIPGAFLIKSDLFFPFIYSLVTFLAGLFIVFGKNKNRNS